MPISTLYQVSREVRSVRRAPSSYCFIHTQAWSQLCCVLNCPLSYKHMRAVMFIVTHAVHPLNFSKLCLWRKKNEYWKLFVGQRKDRSTTDPWPYFSWTFIKSSVYFCCSSMDFDLTAFDLTACLFKISHRDCSSYGNHESIGKRSMQRKHPKKEIDPWQISWLSRATICMFNLWCHLDLLYI